MNCPICKSDKVILEEQSPGGGFYRCGECKTVFAHPMVSGSKKYYEESYGALEGGYGDKKWEFQEVLDSLDSLGIKNGKLLEIACGPGWFLKMAESKGYDVYGIDFNEQAVTHAKSLGLKNVLTGNIDGGLERFGQKFDLVVLIHILEHVEDPNELLRQIKNVLSDKGVVVIDLPNEKRTVLKLNLRKKREGWDYPPHHLTRWDHDSLSNFMINLGFDIVFAKEERVVNPVQIFNFILGVIQINTSTGLMADLGGQVKENSSKADKLWARRLVILVFSRLKKAFSIMLGIIFFIPVYVLSIIFYIRGTNLYVLARRTS